MKFVFDLFRSHKPYVELSSALNEPCAVAATGLSAVHKASVIHTLCKEHNSKAFCICADEREANTLCDDLKTLGMKVLFYPYRDFTFQNVSGVSHDDERKRIGVLMSLLAEDCQGVITCPDAAAQYTIPQYALADSTLNLRVGKTIAIESCVKSLTLLGYERCDAIEGEGQFSLRGGILDFFPPGTENPVRAEFWGDEVDSLSYFDIITQRRTESVDLVTLCPSSEVIISDREELANKIEKKASYLRSDSTKKAKEVLYSEADQIRQGLYISNRDKFIHLVYEETATLFDYIDDSFIGFISEHTAVKDRIAGTEFRFSQDMPEYFAEGVLCRGFDTYNISWESAMEQLSQNKVVYLDNFAHGSYELPLKALSNFNLRLLPPFSGQISTLVSDLDSSGADKYAVVLLCNTRKASENVVELLREQGKKAIIWKDGETLTKGYIHVTEGILSGGFEIPELKFMLFTQSTTQVKLQKKHKLPKNGQAIYSLSELSVGDYVVHTIHGVGVFGGITKLDSHGITKDYIKISYAKSDVLYVPTDNTVEFINPGVDGAFWWGNIIEGLKVNKDTKYTFSYKVQNKIKKNGGVGFVTTRSETINKCFNFYGCFNEIEGLENQPSVVIQKGTGKIKGDILAAGDNYTSIYPLQDAEGYIDVMVEIDGLVWSVYYKSTVFGLYDVDPYWALFETYDMTEDLTFTGGEAEICFMTYTYNKTTNWMAKDVNIYKGLTVDKTTPEITDEPDTGTDAPTTTEAPTTTAKPQETTKAPAATTKAPTTTEAPKTQKGCGGMVAGGLAIVAIASLGAVVVSKKKEN